MREPRRELNLQPEALSLDLRRDFAGENLDGNASPELPILRDEHAAHRTSEKLPLEGVRFAQRQCQCFNKIGQRQRLLIFWKDKLELI